MKILKKPCTWLFSLTFLAFGTNLYAGLAESYGFSALGIGRAGTFVADANGWTAAFYNIGGLSIGAPPSRSMARRNKKPSRRSIEPNRSTRAQKNQRSFGLWHYSGVGRSAFDRRGVNNQIGETGITYIYQMTKTNINPDTSQIDTSTPQGKNDFDEIQANASATQNDMSYGILQIGLSIDLRPIVSTPYDVPLKLGLALSVRDNGALASFNDIDITSYNFLRYGKESEIIGVITGISSQLWKNRLSLGVGGNLGLKGSATFNVKNVGFQIGNEFQTPEHEFKTDVRPNFSAVMGLVYLQPIFSSQEIRLGFSFRQESQVVLDPIQGNAHVRLLNLELPISLALLDFYSPNIYAAGFSYRTSFLYGNTVIVSYDQELQAWSKASISSSKALVYDRQNIQVPTLKDIFISRFSIEYHPTGWPIQVRSGYAYQPSFTPEQSGATNLLDNSRHIMGFGFSLLFQSNLILKNASRLNIGVQYQKSDEKDVIKDTTSTAQLNPSYSYSSDIFVVGADFVLTF